MPLIAPSFLSVDFLHLGSAVESICKHADLLHMDVMDGVFVPNISFGFSIIEPVSKIATKPLDVHLMIQNPEKYALKFAKMAGMVSFHLEALPQPDELLEQLKAAGVKAGLVVNPDFPLEKLFPHLEHCDFVLIMSVFAGFGGQKFIEATYDRVKALKAEITRRGLNVLIEVDGGVVVSNAKALTEAGADILVSGSGIFKADDPARAIELMREV